MHEEIRISDKANQKNKCGEIRKKIDKRRKN